MKHTILFLKLFFSLFLFGNSYSYAQPATIHRETETKALKYRRISLNGVKPLLFLQTINDAQKLNFNSIEVQLERGTLLPIKSLAQTDKQYNLFKAAHDAKLGVYVWIHEFEDIPEKWQNPNISNPYYNQKNDKGNKFITKDNTELWTWLENKYEDIVKIIPDVDGYVLTLSESQYWATGDEEVTFKTVQTIYNVLKKHNKKLVYRTFCYSPQQMELLSKVASRLPKDIVLEGKEVPQDWHFYLPYGTDIGSFPDHEQIIELDVAGEYWGRSLLLNAFPEYIIERLGYYVREKNARGIVARVDRYNEEVRNTFNDINLYAAVAFMKNPLVQTEEVWKQWAKNKFGNQAADIAIRCLKPTWETTKQTIYTKGYIISDRRAATSFIKKFDDKPFNPQYWDKHYEPVWTKIQHPTESFIQETMDEKTRAANTLEKSLLLLEANKKLFVDSVYQELNFQFQRSKITLNLYSLISEMMLRSQLINQSVDQELKQKQWNRLKEIAKELKPLRSKLSEEHIVNGKGKKLQFYLTDIKNSVYDEFDNILVNK